MQSGTGVWDYVGEEEAGCRGCEAVQGREDVGVFKGTAEGGAEDEGVSR